MCVGNRPLMTSSRRSSWIREQRSSRHHSAHRCLKNAHAPVVRTTPRDRSLAGLPFSCRSAMVPPFRSMSAATAAASLPGRAPAYEIALWKSPQAPEPASMVIVLCAGVRYRVISPGISASSFSASTCHASGLALYPDLNLGKVEVASSSLVSRHRPACPPAMDRTKTRMDS